MKFAARHGFGDRVKCTEYELDEMPRAYRAADIVVVPSASHEGTAFAAVEGMCFGKSTVVTHIGGLPNLVIDGLNGVLCDLNPMSLCNALVRASEYVLDDQWRKRVAQTSVECFGMARWERAVWLHLVDALGLTQA
jgi:glycosyltransferase involved in cell wall biosynthesis